MFLPRSLSASADAWNAMQRLQEVFEAETMVERNKVDATQPEAIKVSGASFQWLTAEPEAGRAKDKKKAKTKNGEKSGSATPLTREPFKIANLDLSIQRGQLVAIVGAVGSGKSSILAGMVGEMKRLAGEVKFGGKIAYCSQTAFIQNATLRDNVLFGQAWDEARYWECIEAACLVPDCLQLGDGDLTEIGERGINISGGQKQRVNVARALYFDADIVLFDDPLSALDAHVGQSIFDNAMVKMLKAKGKTVLLITHALHVLPKCDYVYTIEDGKVVEEGTYGELLERKGPFSNLMLEYGGANESQREEQEGLEEAALEGESSHQAEAKDLKIEAVDKSAAKMAAGTGRLEGRLIAQEKRVTGNISWAVRSFRDLQTIELTLNFVFQGIQALSESW
jgi:ABC-type multidrug transport system fused ATPase/permease subunit